MKVISDLIRYELLACGLVVRVYRARRWWWWVAFAEVCRMDTGRAVVRLHGCEWEVSARLELFAEGLRYGRNAGGVPGDGKDLPVSAPGVGGVRRLPGFAGGGGVTS